MMEHPEDTPRQHLQHHHVSVNKVQLRQSSQVFEYKDHFRQFYQHNVDVNINDASHSLYYINELEVRWPKRENDWDLYSIDLVGAKFIIPRDQF